VTFLIILSRDVDDDLLVLVESELQPSAPPPLRAGLPESLRLASFLNHSDVLCEEP
jgi:hypothetical protein